MDIRTEKKRIVVGATGASGMPILMRCLERIREADGYESELILSDGAKRTAEYELADAAERLSALADRVHEVTDIAAGCASGTYPAAGMLIVPCSMKTLAGIHSGYADNLILRAADVTIKEQRPLVLCVRESPLSPIHLRNMHELSMLVGVRIIPPMMAFYTNPKTIDEMVEQVAARLLEPFGLAMPSDVRWRE